MEITKKIPVPTLALQGKWDSINIGVGVIAALGNPSHICLLRNMKEKSLAVIACDGKTYPMHIFRRIVLLMLCQMSYTFYW